MGLTQHGRATAVPVTVIRPRSGWSWPHIGELWTYRELLLFLTWRDVRVRYKQTVLGGMWAILQPVAAMVIFTVFFNRLAGIQPDSDVPYPLWSYAGLLPWTLFSQGLTRASESLVVNERLVTKVYFPRLILPLSAASSALVDTLVASVVYVGLMIAYGIRPGVEILWAPLLVVLCLVTTLGFGLWLSALNALYRDVRHIVPFAIQLFLFVTPVVYPATLVPERFQILYGLNPMCGVVYGFRWCVLGVGEGPTPMFWVSVAVSVALLLTGAVFFRRMEREVADRV